MTNNKYQRTDSALFAQKVRKKINGWYKKNEHYTKAVDRIVLQREEIIGLLDSVKKVNVKKLLRYLDSSGFYYRPSSPNNHHNFPGGLAEHSLGVFRIVEEWNKMTPDERRNSELYNFNLYNKQVTCDILHEEMNYDDIVIAAICHDLCKATRFYFDGRRIRKHSKESDVHSSFSEERIVENGVNKPIHDEIRLAVLTHMRLFSFPPRNNKEAQNQKKGRASMLAIAVWAADKLDASRHPAGRRHFDF